tara:strand:+ start:338 stop:1465 length:1128 start_codon:yes stop_codon:yes gene_type:complete
MTILERVKLSFEMLGGVSSLKEVYQVYKKISDESEISKTFDRSIQARIEENSIDSYAFKGQDIFGTVYGKGKGVWYLKDYFPNLEEAKFIYELKNEREELWKTLKSKKYHSNSFINSNKLHVGGRGVYRDLEKTKTNFFSDGITVSVLDNGDKFDDVRTNTHLTYYYPDSEKSQANRDLGEINSLKNSQKYNVPIFIIFGLEKDESNKEIKLGYIKDYNDIQKNVLIEFKKNKDLVLTNKYEEIIEDDTDIPLLANHNNSKKLISSRRNNNQPLFSSQVFKYYENKCAVCDVDYSLDAAHIIPVKDKGIDHKLNGLILCKNHHKAFDDELFKINPNFNLEFSDYSKEDLRIERDNLMHMTSKPGQKFIFSAIEII